MCDRDEIGVVRTIPYPLDDEPHVGFVLDPDVVLLEGLDTAVSVDDLLHRRHLEALHDFNFLFHRFPLSFVCYLNRDG